LLTLPLMLGLTMTFSTEILFKFFGSFLGERRIASLNYALRIMFILVGFFGQAVGVASYPFLAKLASKGDVDEMNRLLNTAMKFLFIVIPFSVLFIVLRHEIVLILFQRGQFSVESTELTAGLLPYFMIGAVAFSCQTVVVRGFYALQNTLFPALFSTMTVLISLPVLYIFMRTMGVMGVAFGLSLSVIAQTFLLYEIWNRKSMNTGKREVYFFLLKLLPISLLIGLILFVATASLRTIIVPDSLFAALSFSFITGTIFILLLILSGIVFKISEIQTLMNKIYQRIMP